jgi:hypothetical protein
MFLKNNKSAIINSDFVDKSVSELLASGCVKELPFTPFVVSLLSVATNKAGKQRLILDLSLLNKSVRKEKFNYEDWKVAIQLFSKGCYTFKFDLKNGYHHFDVCPQQQTYLVVSWGQKYVCFTVLPFGLLSAPFLFTKCLKTLVKFWRQNGIKIVLYLDDGLGIGSSLRDCSQNSVFVRQSLIDAGFLINEDKSIFTPVQSLEWLGIVWNSLDYSLSIPDRRIVDLVDALKYFLSTLPFITARLLAQVTGRIISMSPVIGNVTRLMTRYCYMTIESRLSWDNGLKLADDCQIKGELLFWLNRVQAINIRELASYSCSSVIIYSDASSVAAGAHTVELVSKVFHTNWSENEKSNSSTWLEMRAIEQAMLSFKDVFKGKT